MGLSSAKMVLGRNKEYDKTTDFFFALENAFAGQPESSVYFAPWKKLIYESPGVLVFICRRIAKMTVGRAKKN